MTAHLTRREVAALLDLHQDSVTRLLPDGLGCAVLAWGGRGKEMLFSRFHVLRWKTARDCACGYCDAVLDDCRDLAAHLKDEQHGIGSCEDCDCPWLRIPHAKQLPQPLAAR